MQTALGYFHFTAEALAAFTSLFSSAAGYLYSPPFLSLLPGSLAAAGKRDTEVGERNYLDNRKGRGIRRLQRERKQTLPPLSSDIAKRLLSLGST